MRSSEFKRLIIATTLGVAFAFSISALALQVDYANTTGSSISFDGSGNFSLGPGSDSFSITSGSAAGLLGDISGTFTIGTITTSGPQSSAPVSGTGELVIHDGASNFKATLQWVDIV